MPELWGAAATSVRSRGVLPGQRPREGSVITRPSPRCPEPHLVLGGVPDIAEPIGVRRTDSLDHITCEEFHNVEDESAASACDGGGAESRLSGGVGTGALSGGGNTEASPA